MSSIYILFIIISAVILLLFLTLKLKINAFISLLIVSIYVGILAGMDLETILSSIQTGMGNTLGFIALIVGLGAIFGQILESSGGATTLANYLVRNFGTDNTSWAMVIAGFIIAIPVFFDVGFIILVPLVYALSRQSKRSVLYYGIPLLAGLAVTHSFIPPTPGPVAIADIIKADLGWVIIFGFILGIPTAIIAGPIFGKYIAKKINVQPPEGFLEEIDSRNPDLKKTPSFGLVISIIAIPLLLIIIGTVIKSLSLKGIGINIHLVHIISFIGHPISALIIATLIAIYALGIKGGFSKEKILELSNKSLAPAGIIILITGAGGVLKQVLIDSSIGVFLAESIKDMSFPPILLAWIIAAIVRVTQGSATVAMITAAGIISPVLDVLILTEIQRALLVIAIASGATILSHVNDSGFWLVGKYFGIDEKQTIRSWTTMETIIAICGLVFCLLANAIINIF